MAEPDLAIRIVQEDGKVRFRAAARDNPPLTLGVLPPFGDEKGYTPLELLLVALSSCASFSLLLLLRNKLKKDVAAVEAEASGTQNREYPRAFKQIDVRFTVRARDTSPEEARRALAVVEEKLCPVWAMLRGNVELSADVEVLPPE